MSFPTIRTIGLAKENESPENPGALEKRVALTPSDVQRLTKNNIAVGVEIGAGIGVGFSDDQYIQAGATMQPHEDLYRNKDMVIKFKGPSMDSIPLIEKKSILFCMAHFHSFPKRAKLLEESKLNVIAMEEILESPKEISDKIILSKCFVRDSLESEKNNLENINIGFIGLNDNFFGGVRRAGNRATNSLTIYQNDIEITELEYFGENAIYFFDSTTMKNNQLISLLKEKNCKVFDLNSIAKEKRQEIIKEYRVAHPPYEFGGRKIQCLHETGMAGARYGFKLLKDDSPLSLDGTTVKATVLGYGNVGMGAIDECYNQGVRVIHILGKRNTTSEKILPYLEKTDLVINGAEQPLALRGKNFLIKSEHTEILKKGAVVIDLVGGSATNRSPVEDVITCTFLTDPHFIKDDIYFSALWGWPMMGMMRESTIKYSQQITDVLLKKENLISGLGNLPKGVKKALVCGPF